MLLHSRKVLNQINSKIRFYNNFINDKKLVIHKCLQQKEKIPLKELQFGKTLTDHMLTVNWNSKTGWDNPVIEPYGPISISPTSSCFHYGVECFEGMKAYKSKNGIIRIFRADKNINRMNYSMSRLGMPELSNGYLECIKTLIKLDKSWIPTEEGYSLYIRPTAIGTSDYLGVHVSESIKVFTILSPVGPYFKQGFKAVKLYADTKNIRAWPGGIGNAKVGGNYGAVIKPTQEVEKYGCSSILWLYGDSHIITEVGTMNIFFVLRHNQDIEIVTPSLERGDILPGITRDSVIEIAKHWATESYITNNKSSVNTAFGVNPMSDQSRTLTVSERSITMSEIQQAAQEGNLLEVFGTGTAATIYPVKGIMYQNQEINVPVVDDEAGPVAKALWKVLTDIQYGKVDHPWAVTINSADVTTPVINTINTSDSYSKTITATTATPPDRSIFSGQKHAQY